MPDPTLLLRPGTSADFPALAAINHASFTTPVTQVMYRKVKPEDKLKLVESNYPRLFNIASTSPHPQHSHFICVVDTTTSTIICYAIWLYLPKGYLASADVEITHPWLPPGTNEALAKDLDRMGGEMRSSCPSRVNSPHWMLGSLATRPEHEGRGAGSMCIRWGCEKADEMGVKCFVDASVLGYPLYKKRGFSVDVGTLEVDLEQYDGGKGLGVQKWVAMMREPESRGEGEGK